MAQTSPFAFPIDKDPNQITLEERLVYYEGLIEEFKRKDREREDLQREILRTTRPPDLSES